jgi:membrane protein
VANEDEGKDWRAGVGLRSNSDDLIDLARAQQPARGREAETPEQIPALGWRDIVWRVFWSISADRILPTS